MLNAAKFRDVVSGRWHGGRAAALRGVLRAAEVPYTLAVDWRNRRYDLGHAAVHRVTVPVISVGNLTLGGTGKTPLVKWLVRRLIERGVRPAIVSRGYGARGQEHNDEARELKESLPGVPHIQNPDRVRAAEQAIAELCCQAIVLDDGFQHRRLARDLDIVLLDALEPFGFEHVFPRGTLREPLSGLQRADAVCLSRADIITPGEREAIRSRVVKIAPNALWCECAHTASQLVDATGKNAELSLLAGRRVLAFCGIGNPAGFRHTLALAECDIVAWREFPDHHAYDVDDVAELDRAVQRSNADLVVCTHKDLVKLQQGALDTRPLWALEIEMQSLFGRQELEGKVSGVGCRVSGVGQIH
jgi:tetraacyldisaccharide 4'-kinase